MNILKNIFSSSSVIEKSTDAIIATGDKLFYTDEEKSEHKIKLGEFHIKLLKAYEPFKLAQRVLAFYFSFIFGICFFITLFLLLIGKDATPIISTINIFGLDKIVFAIILFYFGGGAFESINRHKEKN